MLTDEKEVPVVYVALGDSTGVGVGARGGVGYAGRLFERIERVRPGSRFINLCVSGATSGDVLRGQVGRVRDARPTLVTLGIGINDIGHYVAIEQFTRNYEEIVARLKEDPSLPVIIANIPDISYAPALPRSMREEVNSRILLFNVRTGEIAERHGLLLVDIYAMSQKAAPSHPEFFSDDGFHPSDEGYEYWAKTMWPTLKKAIGQ